MGKCLECEHLTIDSGYHYDSHDCMHPVCFEEVDKSWTDPKYKALYGCASWKEKQRIKNIEDLNDKCNCPYFQEKKSLFKMIRELFNG